MREELYSQSFGAAHLSRNLTVLRFRATDELIRQVTIESPERGLLLCRVRDEVRMTIAAYQTLYQVICSFAFRAVC